MNKVAVSDPKYARFAPKIKASGAPLATGDSVWASFESRLISAGVSEREARSLATNRYQSLIASCTKTVDELD